MTPAQTARELINWYWKEGRLRKGEHHLSTGGWLDQLCGVAERKERLEMANQMKKGSLALWGPSQTGKSTLLSRYIDAGADKSGRGSALDWGTPAIFSDAGREVAPDVVVFNPFNLKTDGSACVTRFVVAENGSPLVDPDHPVQVRMFQPRQLMHALAAGFLSECHPETEQGKKVFWTIEDVRALLRAVPMKGTAPDRAAYELLRDVVEVLQSMCLIKDDRYRNLLADFPTLRQQILECPALLASRDSVLEFAARLFWNSWPSITQVFLDLIEFRQRLSALSGTSDDADLRLCCSLKIAGLLVDFMAYGLLCQEDTSPRIAAIRQLRCRKGGAGLVIFEGSQEPGVNLVARNVDFALLQALAWELIVPLRRDVLLRSSPMLCTLLEKADLLDIPGTANEHAGAESELLTDAALSGGKAPQLFTQVLKRGKTSSMVLSSARNFDIDGFTVMAKWGLYPGSQSQLASGLDAWWRSYTGQPMADAQEKDIPANFVVTFLGEMVSQQLGRPDYGKVSQAFEGLFGKMGAITNPRITSSFATTYRHVPGGRIDHPALPGVDPPLADLEAVYQGLAGRPDFRRQFFDGNWRDIGEGENRSLWHAITSPDGGTDYLFKKLISDAASSPRLRKINELGLEAERSWDEVVRHAAPPDDDAQETKRRLVTEWKAALKRRLDQLMERERSADAAQRVSFWLRRFLHVDAEHIDTSNLVMISQQVAFDFSEEITRQLQSWKEFLPDIPLEEVCIEDRAKAMRLRWYLAEKVIEDDLNDYAESDSGSREGFCRLLLDCFGHMQTDGIDEARSFLALTLARAVVGLRDVCPAHAEITPDTLGELFRATRQERVPRFDYRKSPHYNEFLEPFFDFLDAVGSVPASARGKLPGDDSIRAILKSR